MNKLIAALAVSGFLLAPALHAQEPAPDAPVKAEDLDLSTYETVAVQPVMGLSHSPGVFEAQLAAVAAASEMSADKGTVHRFGQGLTPRGDDAGFGFAGKATTGDVQMLRLGLAIGFLPAMVKADPASAKKDVAELRAGYQAVRGQLDPEVAKILDMALTAAEMGDAQAAAKAVLVAMATSVNHIEEGQERKYGYLASGLYSGLTALFASLGIQQKELAELATPLVTMLEEDAAFGGADRTIADRMKKIAGVIASANPTFDALAPHLTAIGEVNPDEK